MKKLIAVFLAMILSAGMLTGCGQTATTETAVTAESLMKKMQEKSSEASYTEANMGMDFKMAMSGVEIPMKVETTVKADIKKNVFVDMNMSYDMFGNSEVQKTSMYYADGNLYTKSGDTDWTKTTTVDMSTIEQYSNQLSSITNISDNIKYTLGNEEDVEGVKAYKVTGEMSGNEVKTMLSEYLGSMTAAIGQTFDIDNIDFSKMSIAAQYWITSDGDLVKYYMDMTTMINEVMKAAMSGILSEAANGMTIEISKMDITMTSIKMNKTGSVEAPAGIKNSTI